MYLLIKIIFQASLSIFLVNFSSFAYDSEDLQQFKKTKVCLVCDLSEADFANENLENAVLRGSNLSGANFNGANLNNSDLNGANLIGADLSSAKLLNSDINWIRKDKNTKMCRTVMPDGNLNTDC